MSGWLDGSSTICAKMTARAAASGRLAHHRCSVLGCPWRIDFSRALALLIASSGRADFDEFSAVIHGAVPLISAPQIEWCQCIATLSICLTNEANEANMTDEASYKPSDSKRWTRATTRKSSVLILVFGSPH